MNGGTKSGKTVGNTCRVKYKNFYGAIINAGSTSISVVDKEGDAYFKEVNSVRVTWNNSTESFHPSFTWSNDMKSLTIGLKQQKFNTKIVFGLFPFTSVTYPIAPNGTSINVHIEGK